MRENLRRLRREAGMTCQQLANVIGIKTRGGYHQKETGRSPLTIDEAQKLANYLGTNITELLDNGNERSIS
jgi:transcriptional regulator with XRE-family HTH domain